MPLKVIIAGAGIAGLATSISLRRISDIPDIDVQLYEQAPTLSEVGASIALSPNGMRTLERLGVYNALSDEEGYRGPTGVPQIIRHWKTNQVIAVDTHVNVAEKRHHTTRFHRGHLHSALLEHVSRNTIHLNKKVVHAEADDNGVSLCFEDGTSIKGDILIGADGIRSRTRQAFIPDYKLRFSGRIFMRSTFDAALVEGKIPDLPADSAHWWNLKDNFFASRLGRGQYTTVGAYEDKRATEEIDNAVAWDQTGSIQHFREIFKNWNPVVQSLTQLTPYVNLYPNYVGDNLPTFVLASRVTLVGDAAHAHGGAFAAGGSLALDDSLALGLAFKYVFSQSGTGNLSLDSRIQHVMKLYDETRRPHTARLPEIVHSQVKFKPSDNDMTPEEEDQALVQKAKGRLNMDWLSEHDVNAAFGDVIRVREEQKSSKL